MKKSDDVCRTDTKTCSVCGKTKPLNGKNFVVDHCHSTKQVRGLLCHDCNKNVGVVEKWHVAIAAYLTKYQK